MQESSENRQSVYYRYGADGQRALKSSNQSETLYFNTMWSWLHNSSAYNTERESKHIYLGSERLVTRTNGAGSDGHMSTATANTYYYHSDHLGSAQLITNSEGREYERIEYTPYGEYWIEKRAPENKTLPFKFTGKERDEETGLYYYGARYLDPRTSRWLSADPALGEYIPMAPVNDEAKKHNQNLPGMGGIYNTVNFHLYHYAGNNPVKYTDPDGEKIRDVGDLKQTASTAQLGTGKTTIAEEGCTLTTFVRMALALGADTTLDEANALAVKNNLFTNENELTPEAGAKLVSLLLKWKFEVKYSGSATGTATELASAINAKENKTAEYFATARIATGDKSGKKQYDHSLSINSGSLFFTGLLEKMAEVLGFKYNDTSSVNRSGTADASRRNIPLRVDFFRIQKLDPIKGRNVEE